MLLKRTIILLIILAIQINATNKKYNLNEADFNISTYKINNISDKNLTIKELFFRKLISNKNNAKNSLYISAGISFAFLAGYLTFNHSKKTTNNNTNKTIETNKSESNYKVSIKKNSDSSTYSYGKKVFKKGLKAGIIASIAGIIIQTQNNFLNLVKNGFVKLLKPKGKILFNKSAGNTISSLNQLKVLLSIENEKCFKEEVVDFTNYFIENTENLIAITSVLSKMTTISISNIRIIKNSHQLIKNKTNEFIDKLQIILNKNNELFFNENNAKKIFQIFIELQNQIFRFIRLSNSMLLEEKLNSYED